MISAATRHVVRHHVEMVIVMFDGKPVLWLATDGVVHEAAR